MLVQYLSSGHTEVCVLLKHEQTHTHIYIYHSLLGTACDSSGVSTFIIPGSPLPPLLTPTTAILKLEESETFAIEYVALVRLIITTPSDDDIVTLYDTGPHTGSLAKGSHDMVKAVTQMSDTFMLVMGEGAPIYRIYSFGKNPTVT